MRHILLTLLFSGGLLAAPAQEPRSERYRFPVRNVAGLYSANFVEMRPNHFHSGVDIKTDGVTGKPVAATWCALPSRPAGTAAHSTSRTPTARRPSTATSNASAPTSNPTCATNATSRGAATSISPASLRYSPSARATRSPCRAIRACRSGRISTSRCAAAPTSGHSTRWPRNCCPYATVSHPASCGCTTSRSTRSATFPSTAAPAPSTWYAAAKGTMRCGRRNPSRSGGAAISSSSARTARTKSTIPSASTA